MVADVSKRRPKKAYIKATVRTGNNKKAEEKTSNIHTGGKS